MTLLTFEPSYILTFCCYYFQKYAGAINLAKSKEDAVEDIKNDLPLVYRVTFP